MGTIWLHELGCQKVRALVSDFSDWLQGRQEMCYNDYTNLMIYYVPPEVLHSLTLNVTNI